MGAIGASKVLMLFPRYAAWYAAFANANEPKKRIITGHCFARGLCPFFGQYWGEDGQVLTLLL